MVLDSLLPLPPTMDDEFCRSPHCGGEGRGEGATFARLHLACRPSSPPKYGGRRKVNVHRTYPLTVSELDNDLTTIGREQCFNNCRINILMEEPHSPIEQQQV